MNSSKNNYNESFTTGTVSIGDILDRVETDRSLGVPSFQRPLVWDQTQMRGLLLSILTGDPIGSLLWCDVAPKERSAYAPTAIADMPALNKSKEKDLAVIVDGQQRVTSIAHLANNFLRKVKGSQNTWAVEIDVGKALTEKTLKLGHLKLSDKNPPTPAALVESKQLRASFLVDATSLALWQHEYAAKHYDGDREALKADLINIAPGLWHGILNFKIPVITLSKENSLSDVLDYFEKLNTKGEALNSFDIVHSRLSNKGRKGAAFDLRMTTTMLMDKSPALKALGVTSSKNDDLMLPLQLLALRIMNPNQRSTAGQAGVVKDIGPASILQIDPSTVIPNSKEELHIANAVGMLEKAAEFLRSKCGVVAPELLAQKSMLLPIADQLWAQDVADNHVSEANLRKWFLCLSLQGEFHGRTKSMAVHHTKQLHAWAHKSEDPKVISDTTKDFVNGIDFQQQYAHMPKIQSAAVLALLVYKGALDWDNTSTNVSAQSKIELHHICPESKLRSWKIAASERKIIANLTPISAKVNNNIKDKAPKDVFDSVPTAEKIRILESHKIDPAVYEKSQRNSGYQQLLNDREKQLRQLVISELNL